MSLEIPSVNIVEWINEDETAIVSSKKLRKEQKFTKNKNQSVAYDMVVTRLVDKNTILEANKEGTTNIENIKDDKEYGLAGVMQERNIN